MSLLSLVLLLIATEERASRKEVRPAGYLGLANWGRSLVSSFKELVMHMD